jgi:hypothetical protein
VNQPWLTPEALDERIMVLQREIEALKRWRDAEPYIVEVHGFSDHQTQPKAVLRHQTAPGLMTFTVLERK